MNPNIDCQFSSELHLKLRNHGSKTNRHSWVTAEVYRVLFDTARLPASFELFPVPIRLPVVVLFVNLVIRSLSVNSSFMDCSLGAVQGFYDPLYRRRYTVRFSPDLVPMIWASWVSWMFPTNVLHSSWQVYGSVAFTTSLTHLLRCFVILRTLFESNFVAAPMSLHPSRTYSYRST